LIFYFLEVPSWIQLFLQTCSNLKTAWRLGEQITNTRASQYPTSSARPPRKWQGAIHLCSSAAFAAGCRLLVERPDGARLALTLPSLDLASITQLCADFLRD
jgi:hypothetical protein